MKILFLAHRIPYPPNKGDKLRAYNIIRYLSKQNSIHLAALTEDKSDLQWVDELRNCCQFVEIVYMSSLHRKLKTVLSLFSKRPLTLPYFYSKRLDFKIKEMLSKEQYDLIYIYSSSVAQYVLGVPGIKKIMDFIDVDSDKWQQYSKCANLLSRGIYGVESHRLRRYEEKIAKAVDHCIAVSDQEIAKFKSFIQSGKFTAVSNGVDFEYFKFDSGDYEKNRLIFTGTMDYFANVEAVLYFCKNILPLIKKDVPDVKLYIVGANPVKVIRGLANNKDIFVTGFVEDIRQHLARAAVCVAPLRIGRGIRNKVLEAMSAGVPVVTTSEVFCGIEAVSGKNISIGDSPADFAQKTVGLLKDDDLRNKLALNARRFIEERYDWDRKLKSLEAIIEGMKSRTTQEDLR